MSNEMWDADDAELVSPDQAPMLNDAERSLALHGKAARYGETDWEVQHHEPLDQRLQQEEPDLDADVARPLPRQQDERLVLDADGRLVSAERDVGEFSAEEAAVVIEPSP